jgi:hypothetical protein
VHSKSKAIRWLIEEVKGKAVELEDAAAVERWAAWANGVADRIDPLLNTSVSNGNLVFRSPEDRARDET